MARSAAENTGEPVQTPSKSARGRKARDDNAGTPKTKRAGGRSRKIPQEESSAIEPSSLLADEKDDTELADI